MRAFHSFSAALLLTATTAAGYSPRCRSLPSDTNWPSQHTWDKLNATVFGRLIKTIPAGHVCHDPTYNAEACAKLKEEWIYPPAHFDDPSGFMAAYQQNASCDPFTPREKKCEQGNYVDYAVEVHSPADAIAGLNFAKEHNIRLVIKNTGHDYLGKSTGKGALSLWMHKLKSIEFFNYTSKAYAGPAVKMGAGVQAFEAYEAADKQGLNVIGGQCITVGIAGGYSQGGGHSLLSGKHGMGADQVLEWSVLTAGGKLVTASPTQNPDLYWALSGGGGGTYGIVLSLTAKAYTNTIVGGATFSFSSPTGSPNDDALWDAVAFWQQEALPSFVDAGAHVQWLVAGSLFLVSEATIPGATEQDMRAVFTPFTSYLSSQNITYQLNITSLPTFLQHADKYIGPLPYGTVYSAQLQGGIMISRQTTISPATAPVLTSRLRHISTTTNFLVLAYSFNGSKKDPSAPANAVHPGWRDLLTYFVIAQQWNYSVPVSVMDEQERQLTQEIMPPLQELGSGAYMNEADVHNPQWKEEFYGPNWGRLSAVKQKYDPEGVLYAQTAVGSEKWAEDGEKRLCRV